jgi:hypothetical protein
LRSASIGGSRLGPWRLGWQLDTHPVAPQAVIYVFTITGSSGKRCPLLYNH